MIGAAAVAVGAFAAASTPPSTLVDLTTTDSDASGSVSSGDYSATFTGSYYGTKAFDGTSSHENSRWLPKKADNMWVIYTFNTATVVDSIRILLPDADYSTASRAPKDWTFLGSNDKSAWNDVLYDTSTQGADTGWTKGESRYYKFTNTTAYKYYKFNCTANNGATDCMQIQEMEFYCVGTANCTWSGGGETDLMSDVDNWGGTSMPGSGYEAYIDKTNATPAVVPGGLTVYKYLRVGNAGGNSAKVVQTNGTLNILSGGAIGRSGSAGEYSISGGKFIMSGDNLFMSAVSGKDVSVLDISGSGEVEAKKITMFYQASAGSTATIKISGNGKLTLTDALVMGDASVAATGMVYQTGGTCSVDKDVTIGYAANVSGLFEMTGGTCAVSGMNVGRYGTGTLEVTGEGTVLTTKTMRVGFTKGSNRGTGTLVVTNGGEIATTQLYAGAGASATNQATVVFDGAKLTATAANAEFLKNFPNIQLGDGGLTIDTQGHNLGINNCTFNVTGNGKITVVGGGTVTFTNVTVYMAEKPQGAYVFAETDGTFSGLPNLGGIKGCKISLSSDYKRVMVSPKGFIITVF